MTDWRIKDKAGKVEDDLFDVELTQSINAFGSGAVAFLDDTEGTKFDKYPRGSKVTFEAKQRSAGSYDTQLVGYVVERREKDRNGADTLELEVYDVSMLLRRGQVKSDLSGQSISSALNTLITESTAVTWNAGKVSVVDDVTVTREYLNERVDVVLEELALKSANEEFFVDDSLEFNFRARESKKVSRGIDNSQWLDYDIPERAKGELNEIRVYYDGGDRVVTVDNPNAKKELQDELGASRPVTFSEEKMFQDITNRDDAIQAGQRLLNDRVPTLTGTVTTYGLLNAEPGDTIDIRIQPRGLNGEFRIADIEYRWGRDETELTIVENKGNIDDTLKRISDTLKRVEMRIGSDEPDEDDRQIDIGGPGSGDDVGVRILTNTSGDIDGTNLADTAVFTNSGANKIRDSYISDGTVSIGAIKVGTGTSTPSRADTALESSSESVSPTVATPDDSTVRVSGSFSTNDDISEVGVFAGGSCIARGVVDDSVSSPSSATVDITFKDDDSTPNSVITQTGQTLLRDILAANSPTHVDRYVVGTGTTTPSESDTSLATNEATSSAGSTVLRQIDNGAGWSSALSLSNPLIVSGGALTLGQTAYVEDAQNLTAINETTFSDTNYTGDTGLNLDSTLTAYFTADIDYDGGDWAVAARGEFPDNNYRIGVDSQRIDPAELNNGGTLDWQQANVSLDFDSTDQVTVEVGELASSSSAKLDVFVLYDQDHHNIGNFDNSPSNFVDQPGRFSDGPVTASLDSITSVRSVTEATLSSNWNDTSNSQAISLNSNTASNTGSNTFTLSSTDTFNIEFDIDAFGTSSSESPATRRNAQQVNSYTLTLGDSGKTAEGVGAWSTRAFFDDAQVGGATLTEAGQLDSAGNTVSRSVFAGVDIAANAGVIVDELMEINPQDRPADTAFYNVAIEDQNRS